MTPLAELRPDKAHLWDMLDNLWPQKTHALLSRETADQIRKWRREDEAAGNPWEAL
jgi:hypothetical protein